MDIKKRLLTVLVFVLCNAIWLVTVTHNIRVSGYALTSQVVTFLLVVNLVGILLFLISFAGKYKQILLIIFRILFILLAIASYAYVTWATQIKQLDSLTLERKYQAKIQQENQLAEIGSYDPNQVLTEIGQIEPVVTRHYQLILGKDEDTEGIAIFQQDYTKMVSLESLLTHVNDQLVDLTTHLVFARNNEMYLFDKQTGELSRRQLLGNQLRSQTSGQLLNLTAFQLEDDKVAILLRNDQLHFSYQIQEIIIVDPQSNSLESIRLPVSMIKTQCSNQGVVQLNKDTFALALWCNQEGSAMCGGTTESLAAFSTDKLSIASPIYSGGCGKNDTRSLITLVGTKAYYFDSKPSARIFSIDLTTQEQTILLTEAELPPNSFTASYAGDSLVAVHSQLQDDSSQQRIQNQITHFDLTTRSPVLVAENQISKSDSLQSRFSQNKILVSEDVATANQEYFSLDFQEEAVELSATDDSQLPISGERQAIKSFTLADSTNSAISIDFSQIIPIVEKLVQFQTSDFLITRWFVVDETKILLELVPRHDAINTLGPEDYLTAPDLSAASRVVMIDIRSGKVFLVDHNRSTNVAQFNSNSGLVVLRVDRRMESSLYRILDLKNQKSVVSFTVAGWTFTDPSQMYGQNLFLPLHDYFNLAYKKGKCENFYGQPDSCIISEYEIVLGDEKVVCTDEICTLSFVLGSNGGADDSSGSDRMRATVEFKLGNTSIPQSFTILPIK